jgi:hypothetical protein
MQSPFLLQKPAWLLAVGLGHLALVSPLWAQQIYTCVDGQGRKITSDRPIAECLDREQKLLNRDGSKQGIVGPSMTAEERAAYEEAQRRKLVEDATRRDMVRHDRNLLGRYPTVDMHQKARESALEPTQQALKIAEKRLADLGRERSQLQTETEFYQGKELPRKLKVQIEQNQAATEAQRHSIEQHRAEIARIDGLYDEELARLKKLWAGAQPGTVGPIPTASVSSAVNPTSASAPR